MTGSSQLPEDLLRSLAEGEDRDVERVWLEEAEKRREELRRDPTLGIPVEKVLARLKRFSDENRS